MVFGWNGALNDLIFLLVDLYSDRDKARLAVKRAVFDPGEIDFDAGGAKVFWLRIVEEAARRDNVQALINVAKQDFENVNFGPLEQHLREPMQSSVAPRTTDGVAPPAREQVVAVGTTAWEELTQRRAELIHKKNREGLNGEERIEFEQLQQRSRAAIARAFPSPPPSSDERIAATGAFGTTEGATGQ